MGRIVYNGEPFDCALARGDNALGECAWCGEQLTGRRTRWCSTRCAKAFAVHHCWTDARRAALRRANFQCEECGEPLSSGTVLEVDHRNPIHGRHNQVGCFHHPSNLRVLCHPDHVAKTARDRAEGLI